MADDILIRQASLKDIKVIQHHRRAMFNEMGIQYRMGLDAMHRSTRGYLARTISEGSYKGWLAETRDGQVVAGGGVAVSSWPPAPGYPYPQRASIFNVYAEPLYRRRGLARKLMLVMIEWCRKRGFTSVFLHASKDGRPLYESLGFEATNEMRLPLRSGARKSRK